MKRENFRILVCDDDHSLREIIVNDLYRNFNNIQVIECENGIDGFSQTEAFRFDLIISDYNMGIAAGDGISLYKYDRSHSLNCPFIILSGEPQDRFSPYLNNSGFLYLPKPSALPDLINEIIKLAPQIGLNLNENDQKKIG